MEWITVYDGQDRTVWEAGETAVRLELLPADFGRMKAIRFRLACSRQSGARIRLEALNGADETVASLIFAADWEGENAMCLWLSKFETQGHTGNWAEARALRLRCEQPGLWPTTLTLYTVEVTHGAPVWEVNESDTVFEMGWGSRMSGEAEWEVVQEASRLPAAHSFAKVSEPWLTFIYRQGDLPGVLTIERRFDFPVTGMSQLLAKLNWDKDGLLTASVLTDGGRWISFADKLAFHPEDEWITLGLSLEGVNRLHAVRLTLEESKTRKFDGREVGIGLFWLLLRKPTGLDEMPVQKVLVRLASTYFPNLEQAPTVEREVRQVPFRHSVTSATPIGDPLQEGLPFGFYINKENLPVLRRRYRDGRFHNLFAGMIAEADRAIATELVDRNYYGSAYGGGIGLPKGLNGGGMRMFAPVAAAAHLITEKPGYAIAARRWILRTVRSEDWRGDHGGSVDRPQIGEKQPYWDSFTGWYPKGFAGYMNHPFVVTDVAFGTAVAYDMLYHCFDREERSEIEAAFVKHGTYMLYDKLRLARDRYIRFNQGVLFALPLLMQTAFLKDRDPVFADMHEWTLEFLREFADKPWNDEGVCGEGPGYGAGTALLYVEAVPPIAACLGVPIREAVPPSLFNVMDYLQHCRSTWWPDRPRFVGLSDASGDNWIKGDLLAFYANYGENPAARYFWEESDAAQPSGSLVSLLFTDLNGVSQAPTLPPAKVFRDQPMAFLRTGWQYGDTLLLMTNIRQVTGHGHLDRASVVFEYNGEQLLLDPGMIGYSEPNGHQYEHTFCHNTLTFSQRNQLGGTRVYETSIDGFLSTSGPSCPGREGGIDWVIANATAVYPEAESFVRHILFLRPGIVVLIDAVKARQPEVIDLNFTCLGPLTGEGEQFVSTAARNELVIHSQGSSELVHAFGAWGTAWPDRPSYRLIRSTLEPAAECLFLTVLAPHAIESSPPTIVPIRIEGGLGVRVIAGQAEEIVLCGNNNSSRSISGDGEMETDARIAVLRRYEGRLIGQAMLGGTFLAAKGETARLQGDGRQLTGSVLVNGEWVTPAGADSEAGPHRTL